MKHRKTNRYLIIILFLSAILLEGCKDAPRCEFEIGPGTDAQSEIQNAFNAIEQGCIEFEDGRYEFDRTLTIDDKADVILEGKGRDNTVFSFSGQISGGEGILITNSQDIVVRDFTILDAAGDGLKFRNSHGIVMSGIGTVWSGEPSEENGAYGLYPVLSSNILIEDSYAYGASDAGIYVGQSDKAIVRDSEAEGNVIGIEIENTTNAEVSDNMLHDNTAGIVVVNLPGLSKSGSHIRVYDNNITGNLRGNFAHPGHIPAEVPAGTGILVLSIDEVEIFDNTLDENNVAGTAVASYLALVELGLAPDPPANYDPYPQNIYIHNNTYSRSNTYPPAEEQSFFGNLLVDSFGAEPIPDIILDGIFAQESGESGTICIEKNSGNNFVNLNLLSGDFPNSLSFDQAPHECSMNPLEPVNISVPNF